MVLACHASKARQAFRATRLWVGREAVVALLHGAALSLNVP